MIEETLTRSGRKQFQKFKIQISNLEGQIRNSRVAIDNISNFSAIRGKYKDTIQCLQSDLHTCISRTAEQQTKQKTLEQLIAILQAKVYNEQTCKTKQKAEEQQKLSKQIEKQLSQIDKISQKYNEQVAKISKLKQQANMKRSERVVYSGLFKKLEKEIKQYEEIYKQQIVSYLLFQESHQRRLYDSQLRRDTLQTKKEIFDEDQERKICLLQLVKKNYNQEIEDSCRSSVMGCQWVNKKLKNRFSSFLDNQKHSRFFSAKNNKQELKKNGQKQQKLSITKQILKSISNYNLFFQQIFSHTECQSTLQILTKFSSIQQENNTLLLQIQQIDNKIDNFQQKQVQYKKLQQAASLQSLDLDPIPSPCQLLSPHLSHQLHFLATHSHMDLMQNLSQIAQLFSISLCVPNSNPIQYQSSYFLQQKLHIMDERVSILLKEIKQLRDKEKEREKISERERQRDDKIYGQTLLGCLFEKMDKYYDCETIIDREGFRGEYEKELGRRRYTKARKNINK